MIDEACLRILCVQIRFARRSDPLPAYDESLVASEAHIDLPLDPTRLGKLAVLGRLAPLPNTGDNGSRRVSLSYLVTPLEGLRRALGEDRVIHAGEDDPVAVAAAMAAADAAAVVVGYTAVEEGEYIIGDIALGADKKQDDTPTGVGPRASISGKPIGGDRASLGLPQAQIDLIRAAAASGKPVTVVIVAGSAVMVEEWREEAAAIVLGFYAGMEGGTALADLLLGNANFSGRLPFTVARDEADYPFFDADAITYGYGHGYAKFDREAREPRYAFGHGLSYTTFAQSALAAEVVGEAIRVRVKVANTGALVGEQVVQCYVGAPGLAAERPLRSFRAFARVAPLLGETREVQLGVPLDGLRWRDPADHSWKLEAGTYNVCVGASSRVLDGVDVTLG